MARITWILILSAILFTALKYLYHINMSIFFTLLKNFKETPLFQTAFYAVLLILMLYLLLEYIGSSSSKDPAKFYAAQISLDEYETQKRSFTQQKLAELFNTREYQEYIRQKNLIQSPKVQDLVDSDDEL